MKKFITIIFFLSIISLFSQEYTLKSYVIGSSAATVSNEQYTFQSTVGQSAIGEFESNTNKVKSGFWYGLGPEKITQLIRLNQGWNLISSYISPENPDIKEIFKNLRDKIIIVKNVSGKIYLASTDFNQIGNWANTEAYQVYAKELCTLSIEGLLLRPSQTPITFTKSGWHLISYLRASNLAITTALEDLTEEGKMVITKNNKGQIYMTIPNYINTILNMEPGQGYQIYVNGVASFYYPD